MLLSWFQPELSEQTFSIFRASYGVLLLLHLLGCLPNARRFFLGERWGGYGKSSPFVDALHNPGAALLVGTLWFACGVLLVTGSLSPWPALVNLLLCRYYFLHMRWRGVLRGMGAPGFMTNWLAGAVFVLELARSAAPAVFPLALFVLQTDFALIMFVAGIYKLNAGYATGEGMEYGLVNPQWGRWWQLYRPMPPRHFFFTFNNHMAWGGEIVAGVLMLIPATRFWGALFIFLSFIYIHANVRLSMLPFMVMLACVLFVQPGGPAEPLMGELGRFVSSSSPAMPQLGSFGTAALTLFLWIYLCSLPLVYAGLSYNLYRKKALPGFLQRVLDGWANFFGFILWRVFSADLTHFFVQIHVEGPGGERRLLSRWGGPPWSRWSHVGEAITVTCLFTTLKYYPNNPELFRERLVRYARTVPHQAESVLVFECVTIERAEREFRFVPVTEFVVSVRNGTIEERLRDEGASMRQAITGSPVHEAVRPGSYVGARN
jgi:hypothetical protein